MNDTAQQGKCFTYLNDLKILIFKKIQFIRELNKICVLLSEQENMKPGLSSLTNSPENPSRKNCNQMMKKSQFCLNEEKSCSSLSPPLQDIEYISPINLRKTIHSNKNKNKNNIKITNFNAACERNSPFAFESPETIKHKKCVTYLKIRKELGENMVRAINSERKRYSTPRSNLPRNSELIKKSEFDSNFSKLHEQFRQSHFEKYAKERIVPKDKVSSGKSNKQNRKVIKKSISMNDFLLFNRTTPSRSKSQIEFSDLLLRESNYDKNKANSLHLFQADDPSLSDIREMNNYCIINEILSQSKIRKCQSVLIRRWILSEFHLIKKKKTRKAF